MMWMPHQDMRDGTRARIDDTWILNFMHKSLGNHVVGFHMVQKGCDSHL